MFQILYKNGIPKNYNPLDTTFDDVSIFITKKWIEVQDHNW